MAITNKALGGAVLQWAVIKQLVEKEEWEANHEEPGYGEQRGIFLGTVFALTPSSKYYMFWCSNFTDAEAEKDAIWWERNEKHAERYGLSLESGEGDPCDIFVMQYREKLT